MHNKPWAAVFPERQLTARSVKKKKKKKKRGGTHSLPSIYS
jgi:hypothetical protein